MVLNKKFATIAMCCALLVSASACGNNGQAALESIEAESIETESVEVESVVLVEEETEHETEAEAEQINYVEVGFVEASTATKKDLTGSTGKWEFKGLPLLPDDCEWIDTSWNKDGSVEYGALYRKVAMLLEGFDIGVNNGSAYADLVFGVDFTSKADLEPYVENASTFIVEEDSFQAVMHKLEECETVTGDFDYTYGDFGRYSVDISDACECAKELQISDEMFGYVLASLLEKAAEISFDGMSCHIEYVLAEDGGKTYDAYYAAINLSKEDLIGHYSFRGLPLLSTDCEWIDNPINENGSVKQTAMYMKMGVCLSAFGLGREAGNKWTDYAEILIGFVPETRQEMIPYVENAVEFIITSTNAYEIASAVMHKMESLSCTSGSYDYEANSYEVKISDLTTCADEMMISEEMLGYIIATFDSMGADIVFENNECSISL